MLADTGGADCIELEGNDAVPGSDAAIDDTADDTADATVDATVEATPGFFNGGAVVDTAGAKEMGALVAAIVAALVAAAFDFTIPGFATPGFFFGRLARISSRSFINACPNSFWPLQFLRMADFGSLIEMPIPRIVSFGRYAPRIAYLVSNSCLASAGYTVNFTLLTE